MTAEDEAPPAVLLARMVLAGLTTRDIASRLPAGSPLERLFDEHRAGLASLGNMLRESGVDHGHTSLEAIGRSFDLAVRRAPESSVAAYCLGDPALLARATDEIVEWLRDEDLIGPEFDVLDVGCGIGRIAAALAPSVRSVLGIDVAPAMIEEARRRSQAPNLRFAQTDGRALPAGEDSLDLVLFVDSMPYLVQAGLADLQLDQAARRLRDGGALVVLNLCYGGDAHARARDWAARLGLTLRRVGDTPFRSWDGAAFVFEKPGARRRR